METKKMVNEALGSAVLKSAPVGGVGVAALWGVALADWTLIIACLVGLAQLIHSLYSTYLKWKNRNQRWDDSK